MTERDTTPRLGAVAPLEPGDPAEMGRYALTGRLGAGGMGTVYLGRAPGGPAVAVKVVHPELAGDPEFRARFADEVAAARRVAPFCTARVVDADTAAPVPYLVTEFVDGVPLSVAVAEGGPLDPSTLHGVALGVAAALSAVHAAGVVHRDLKPGNVLLSLSGPRVIDFGIARALDVARQHTQVGMLVGTPGWMAPEQFRGGSVGPAADVFSWGSLVAYAATGRNPWQAAGSSGPSLPPTEQAHRILHGTPSLDGLTGSLRRLVESALAKDPGRRPTARQLVDALLGGPAADPTRAAVGVVERTWTGLPTLGPTHVTPARPPGTPGPRGTTALPDLPYPRPGPPGSVRTGPAGLPVAGPSRPEGSARPGPAGSPAAGRPGPPVSARPGPAGSPAAGRPGPPVSARPGSAAPPAAGPSGPPGSVRPWSAGPAGPSGPLGSVRPRPVGPPSTGRPGAARPGGPPAAPARAGGPWVPVGPGAAEAGPTRVVPGRRAEPTRTMPPVGPPGPVSPTSAAASKRVRRRRPPPGPVPTIDVQPRPKRRRWFLRKRLLVPLGLLALFAVLAPRAGGSPPATAGSQLNEPVRDGNLEFVVSRVRCGVDQIGTGVLKRSPKGQFCLVDVKVTNVKDDARTLYEPFQKLVDTAGDKHGADIAARFVYRDQNLWDKVQPGKRVSGTMVFDIPADARPQRLELHDGPISGGVAVTLR